MGEVYPLDLVIKKVDHKTRANAEEERLVIIDRSTRKEKRSFLARDVEYFIVANNKNYSNYANNSFDYQVNDFETELNLRFTIKYKVSCEPGNEVKVAEVLWDNIHPGAELERRIKEYISYFFNVEEEVANIIKDSSKVIKKLKKFVVEKIEQDIGLNTQLGISLGRESNLGNSNTSFISSHFPVKLKDYPEPLDLKFELELSSTGEVILPYTVDKLQKMVQEKITKYLFDQSSAEEFLGELDTTLRKKIILYLNDELANLGRQVVSLSLVSSDIVQGSAESFFQTYFEVSRPIQEKQVTIKNRLLMVLDSMGKYRVSGSPNLQTWVEKNLDSVIQFVLFDKSNVELLENFSLIKEEIKNAIKYRAKNIGYSIQQIVSELDTEQFDVEPLFETDCEVTCRIQEKQVTIKSYVAMKLENTGKYIINNSPNLKTWFEKHLNLVVKSVLPNNNYANILLNSPSIQGEIKDKMLEEAKVIGYSVQQITCRIDGIHKPSENFEIEYDVDCHAQQEEVRIKNRVRMTLESFEQYIEKGSPDLQEWVKYHLDSAIRDVLFNETYLNVVVNFSPIEKNIKDEVAKQAKAIGYAVKHIASVPEMEPLKLTKYFSTEVERDDFETKQSGVKVGLNVVVDAKIDDLEKIQGYINPRFKFDDFQYEMERAIEGAVRSFLHTVEPERFYMQFFSVEKEIENRIKEELKNSPFYATVKSVTPKTLETEITRRYQELQGKMCPFEFEVNSLKGGEPIKFKGNIQVEAINKDMWGVFQSRQYQLEEIKSKFEEHIKVKLATYSQTALQYNKSEEREALEVLLNEWGNYYIKNNFGLEVSINTVSRQLTDRENIKYKIHTEYEQKKLEQTKRMMFAPLEEDQQKLESHQNFLLQANKAESSRVMELFNRRNILAKVDAEGNKKEIEEIDMELHQMEHTLNNSYEKVINKEPISLEDENSVSGEASFIEIAEKEGLFDKNQNFNRELKRIQEGE